MRLVLNTFAISPHPARHKKILSQATTSGRYGVLRKNDRLTGRRNTKIPVFLRNLVICTTGKTGVFLKTPNLGVGTFACVGDRRPCLSTTSAIDEMESATKKPRPSEVAANSSVSQDYIDVNSDKEEEICMQRFVDSCPLPISEYHASRSMPSSASSIVRV